MKSIVLSSHTKEIRDLCFNKESDLLFSGSTDRLVNLWVTETGERLGNYKIKAAVMCIKVTSDSKYLFVGDSNGGLSIWEVNTGNLLKELNLDLCAIRSIDLSYGEKYLSMSYYTREKDSKSNVLVYNIDDLLRDNKSHMKSFTAPLKSKFLNSKFLNVNKSILCSRDDGCLQLFDYNTGDTILEKKIHEKDINYFDISKKEEIIFTAGKDGSCHVVDPETLDIIHTITPNEPIRGINSCKISPLFSLDDENEEKYHAFLGGGIEARDTALQGGKGGFELIIANLMYGEEMGNIHGHFSPIYAIALSNNGRIVATGAHDSTVRMSRLDEDYMEMN